MKIILFFTLLTSIYTRQSNNLIGNWIGELDGKKVILTFKGDSGTVFYEQYNTRHGFKFSVKNKLLKLEKEGVIEYHQLHVLTANDLALRPLKNNQISIPVIDEIHFKRN